MLKTLITVTAIALIAAITVWIVRRACARCDARSQRQFPTAYTLLKSSPLILKRELPLQAGDVGSQSDRCIIGGISTTIIDRGHLMDPVTFLLLFNITVWCYWTFK